MHAIVERKRAHLGELCRRFGIVRLAVFGSASRDDGFSPDTSDVDFLVEFAPQGGGLAQFLDFREALESAVERPVDLVDRRDLDASRNYIRRRSILGSAEPVYVG